MKNITLDELIPAAMLAVMLGKAPKTLANWRCLGKGPEYVKIGADIYYPKSGVTSFISSRLVQPEQEG